MRKIGVTMCIALLLCSGTLNAVQTVVFRNWYDENGNPKDPGGLTITMLGLAAITPRTTPE